MTGVQKNWLEWSVFSFGLTLILALIAYLTFAAVTIGNDPPIVEVEVGAAQPRNGTYVVPVTLRNLGDRTAESVVVEVALVQGGTDIETAELTIDFLPRQSTRSGWVTFSTNPAAADSIEPHVFGYQEP